MKEPNEQVAEEASKRDQYHPALCNAMELALYYDRDLLKFVKTKKLDTLPREIDFLVIRKEIAGEIKNELGRIFRRCNIWEFKGYGDKLNAQVYHKTMSYAYEYLVLHKELDGIADITLSFLREGEARDLMKWLEEQGYVRFDSPDWVSRYRRTGSPDLQIVNIAHPEAPTILKVLSHKAEPEDIKKASDYIKKMPDSEQDKGRLVMELSYKINGDLRGGADMGGFFETYVDPLQEIIKQKDVELQQKDAEIEQKDAEIEQKEAELEQSKAEIARLKAQIAASI